MTNARFQQRLGRRDRFFIGCCCVWGLFLLFLVAVVLFLKKKVKTAGLVSLTPSSRFFFQIFQPMASCRRVIVGIFPKTDTSPWCAAVRALSRKKTETLAGKTVAVTLADDDETKGGKSKGCVARGRRLS